MFPLALLVLLLGLLQGTYPCVGTMTPPPEERGSEHGPAGGFETVSASPSDLFSLIDMPQGRGGSMFVTTINNNASNWTNIPSHATIGDNPKNALVLFKRCLTYAVYVVWALIMLYSWSQLLLQLMLLVLSARGGRIHAMDLEHQSVAVVVDSDLHDSASSGGSSSSKNSSNSDWICSPTSVIRNMSASSDTSTVHHDNLERNPPPPSETATNLRTIDYGIDNKTPSANVQPYFWHHVRHGGR